MISLDFLFENYHYFKILPKIHSIGGLHDGKAAKISITDMDCSLMYVE